jgi:hypothetical protein
MRLRTWSALLVLLTACASAPAAQAMPRPPAFASTPTSSSRIRLVSAPMEPAPERSRIGRADLDQARALLSRARLPHLGGHDPHNECADKMPNNSFPGWDVFVNGKNFDAR